MDVWYYDQADDEDGAQARLMNLEIVGHRADQLPRGCWLLRNARVKHCDYGDVDAETCPGHQLRRVYLNHNNGLSVRHPPSLIYRRKARPRRLRFVPAQLRYPLNVDDDVVMGDAPANESSTPDESTEEEVIPVLVDTSVAASSAK